MTRVNERLAADKDNESVGAQQDRSFQDVLGDVQASTWPPSWVDVSPTGTDHKIYQTVSQPLNEQAVRSRGSVSIGHGLVWK